MLGLMRLHRFIVDADLRQAIITLRATDLLRQWTNVLRLRPGDRVMLCDGQGLEAEAMLRSTDRKTATLELQPPRPVTAEPMHAVTLYCSVLKRENFEWVVQKCTEIGVKAIVPIVASRTVKTGLKMERLRMIAKEAAEQSGRGTIPNISKPMEFSRALSEGRDQTNVFFHIGQHHTTKQPSNQKTSVGVWVGPEGGWTEEEAARAKAAGAQIATLGALTLRAETAAIVASYEALRS